VGASQQLGGSERVQERVVAGGLFVHASQQSVHDGGPVSGADDLESGSANPTLAVLHWVAGALQVSLEELLAPLRAASRFYPRGSLPLVVAAQEWVLEPGDVISFRADQRHSYANPTRETAVGYSVVLLAPMSAR
jgi:transcriptional regulator with XRE-family HTH domain